MNNWYSDFQHGKEYRNDLIRQADTQRLVRKIKMQKRAEVVKRRRKLIQALKLWLGRYLVNLGSRIRNVGTRLRETEIDPASRAAHPQRLEG